MGLLIPGDSYQVTITKNTGAVTGLQKKLDVLLRGYKSTSPRPQLRRHSYSPQLRGYSHQG